MSEAPKTIDFAARMAAKRAAAAPAVSAACPAGPTESVSTIPIRRFNDKGLRRVAELLEQVRTENDLHADDFDELLTDPEYSDSIKEPYRIDPAQTFPTKLDLCKYFTEKVFPDAYLESSAVRADAGLWTWLAIAYYKQFVKVKKDLVKVATDARWIYEPDVYRLARRHFIAGTLDLYRNIGSDNKKVCDMLFGGPVMELSRFVDVLTYVPDCSRCAVFLLGAVTLYYDADARSKVRHSAFDRDKPWSVWQYIRVFQQFKQTRDFFDAGDVKEFLRLLPKPFQDLKLHQ